MKTELRALAPALGEVVANRQRLDGIADQLRAMISGRRVVVQSTERAAGAKAADERAAQHQREQQEADHKAAEKAAARAALDRLLLEVFKPLVDSGVELARQHIGRKPQRRQPSQPRKTKPATKAARPSSQN